jgi:hypothetical protein
MVVPHLDDELWLERIKRPCAVEPNDNFAVEDEARGAQQPLTRYFPEAAAALGA